MTQKPESSTTVYVRTQAASLASELTGNLPCARCRYNLRGLSVRGTCPECGVPVRATLLAKVDPHAAELQPLSHPYLTAAGLQLWAFSALAAALGSWVLRCPDLAYLFGLSGSTTFSRGDLIPRLVPVLFGLSGLGACSLLRPHAGISRGGIAAAAGACIGYVVLVALAWRINVHLDSWGAAVFFGSGPHPVERSLLRLVLDAAVAGIALGLRPNAQLLVARSLLLRSGNVDRQTLTGLAGASAVAFLGDLLHIAAGLLDQPRADLIRLTGTMLVGLGSTLLTIGLIGVAWDCVRMWPVTVAPPLALEDVVGPVGET